ncbi:MAG TPA: vanadium-dependent haloperoxidase [Longimicrobium sp.]|nr:vanadium-dependent haloperoxidase [Longimicrobium sp.]
MAKAETLIDTFNDDVTGSEWAPSTTPGVVADHVQEVNGRVEIRPASGTAGSYGRYTSTTAYDLTDSFAHLEVVQAPRAVPGTLTWLKAASGASEIALKLTGTVLSATQNATELAHAEYDPVAHRWWRLAEQDGTTYWQVSPDGHRWRNLVFAANPFTPTAVTFQFGTQTTTAVASPGVAVFDNFNALNTSLARRVEERRNGARGVRVDAARLEFRAPQGVHVNNNDEVNYPTKGLLGNFSKGLKHDGVGDPDPLSYASLLRALESRDPHDFEEIILGTLPAEAARQKLTNPQSGLAFDVEGPDAQRFTLPPAPRFDSPQAAHEAGELYWMAAARDVAFVNYGTDPVIAAAVASLNGELAQFGGTTPVTTGNVFRGIYPGEQVGPYVSQFLVKGSVDTRKPALAGLDATDGFVSYGAKGIDQRIISGKPGVDYLTDLATWLDVQNGSDKRGLDQFENNRRFIYTLRAGATFVHFDQVLNAFYDAAWYLMSEPAGNQSTAAGATGRPQADAEFPRNAGNPYDPPGTAMDSKTQVGFATFGPIHLLQVLAEVIGRAGRAVWWQKWGVHRRLRPEEYGGRVDNHLSGRRSYGSAIDVSLRTSLSTGGLSAYYGAGKAFATYFLPQAYPEGAPLHPAYGAGHATISGACITILKAFFDESAPIENPLQSASGGSTLVAYNGADKNLMTVGGELNKLAGNIALFRNAAGVHWRSDYTESLPLGEAVAIALLQEMSLGFNEDDAYFQLTRLDGQKIRIFDGKVVAVSF